MNDYRYCRLNESNFADVVHLIKVIYHVDVNVEQFRKKYATDSFGASYIGYIAYHNETNEVAAYYGIFPLRVKLNETIVMAAQSGDTMTHPAHRNKGLFVELAKQTYELGKSLGIQFVYGFPNQFSYPGLVRKLGWTHAYDMLSLNLLVPTLPYAHFLIKWPNLSTWHSKTLLNLLKKFFVFHETLPETLLSCQKQKEGVMHDQDFFDYKLGYNCILLQHQDVYMVLKVENNNIGIGALYNYGEFSGINKALRRLKLICALMGVMRIRTYCSPNNLANINLGKLAFSKKSLAYCYLNFGIDFDLGKLNFTYLDYDTF
ncbi:GNAT family N-acetyltransferase [Legionella lytica]|uniref:GNAT family N-acetyltransferase n=1 Tax=Legionella lytica TaxID=96232 RepID=A0ABY4Y7A7_9GAMM|nr:GNAT family N-acetyltransferase [Legionella lytica]USQ13518.1 GNAT family N-acetyltransferase [Legionella lytica]